MPWMFVVNGVCLTIEASDDSDYCINDTAKFKEIKEKAEKNGFLFSCSTDDEEDETSFFVGTELLPGRHIYQGQTHCIESTDIENQELLNEIVVEIKALLQENYSSIREKKGIIINQFD